MKVDFTKFEQGLPYASELYGIYQPLLGWRSRVRTQELASGVSSLKRSYLRQIQGNTRPVYQLPAGGKLGESPFTVSVGERVVGRSALDAVDSIVAGKVGGLVAKDNFSEQAWRKYTSSETLNEILASSRKDIEAEAERLVAARDRERSFTVARNGLDAEIQSALAEILERESMAAGVLRRLGEENSPAQVAEVMKQTTVPNESPFLKLLELLTPAQSDLADATISPIGLVRLYRQYFFEFDNFLGPPVQHLWLSPGGTVELVETSTRRTLVERTNEQAFESLQKSENSATTQDDLSDAVRSDNSANTKLGVTLSSTGTYGICGFVDGSTTVGSSFNVEQSSKQAREQTHKAMRQQSDKLSSDIRKSYKSTFKTVTETTDTQSRRHVINNTTAKLINYELRRKMRQVGVQVQDYGLQMCWQAYVDMPGEALGLAKLVHIAAPADLQGLKEPEAATMPEPEIKDKPFSIRDLHFGTIEGSAIGPGFIVLTGKFQLTPPKAGYIFDRAEVARTNNTDYATLRAYPQDALEPIAPGLSDPPEVTAIPTGSATTPTEPSVRSIVIGWKQETARFGDGHNYFWDLDVSVIWKPSQKLLADSQANYNAAMKTFTAEKERHFREALYTAARARITAASKVEPRKFEELREEERIVIYRSLIRKLLEVAGITNEDPKLRHVFAELVQSMFDVDKMLYFVAPEWWMPRNNYSHQNIGLHPANRLERVSKVFEDFDMATTVGWGGPDRRSDYYITEDSVTARLGSSLGWVLQLDGDNLRNAFLNAPWVKAVIPIRPGREWKALAWLSSDAIEGSDGLEGIYQATDKDENKRILLALKAQVWEDSTLTSFYGTMSDPAKIRIIDAIRYLILNIQERHKLSLEPIPNPDDATMSYLPTDEVFEHGFDPLKGGFKAAGTEPFKIFDQWVEVLPTDQIVPVEVAYDPKTGKQL